MLIFFTCKRIPTREDVLVLFCFYLLHSLPLLYHREKTSIMATVRTLFFLLYDDNAWCYWLAFGRTAPYVVEPTTLGENLWTKRNFRGVFKNQQLLIKLLWYHMALNLWGEPFIGHYNEQIMATVIQLLMKGQAELYTKLCSSFTCFFTWLETMQTISIWVWNYWLTSSDAGKKIIGCSQTIYTGPTTTTSIANIDKTIS